jgi:hypothetical protein
VPVFFLFPQETSDVSGIYASSQLKADFPLFDLPCQIDAMDTSGYGFFGSYTSPGIAPLWRPCALWHGSAPEPLEGGAGRETPACSPIKLFRARFRSYDYA